MTIGNQNRWWNRRVPILRISIVIGGLYLGFRAWMAYGNFVDDLAWSIHHSHTATFRGQSLALPRLWKKENGTNYNEFELTRNTFTRSPDAFVTVTYSKISIDEIPRISKIIRHRFPRAYRLDSFDDQHYVCTQSWLHETSAEMVDCLSRDGRWDVVFLGAESNRADFEAILHGVAVMGDPTK